MLFAYLGMAMDTDDFNNFQAAAYGPSLDNLSG